MGSSLWVSTSSLSLSPVQALGPASRMERVPAVGLGLAHPPRAEFHTDSNIPHCLSIPGRRGAHQSPEGVRGDECGSAGGAAIPLEQVKEGPTDLVASLALCHLPGPVSGLCVSEDAACSRM